MKLLAIDDRNNIISGILSHQNTDGSFDGDAYSTAAAITALAPYYETSGAYTITQNQTGWTFDLSPRDAVENGLNYLSGTQSKDGDWGDLRSTAMTVIALDTMGIDCNGDERFTARKGTAFDGLMSYQEKDGGFAADGNKSDGEATSYALCALTSHLRKVQGKAELFNFSVNDAVTFETPATAKPASNTSGSTSSSNSTSKTAATTKPTTKPTTKATTKPTSTKNPSKTMQPTKTTTPKSEATPDSKTTPKPTSTPKTTKRPALVGPVEMPGPMQPTDPPEINSSGASENKTSGSAAPVIVVGIIAVIALGAFAALFYLKKTGKLPDISFISKLLSRKKKPEETYKAKRHRKTEQHRRFEERERYKNRKKYDKRRI